MRRRKRVFIYFGRPILPGDDGLAGGDGLVGLTGLRSFNREGLSLPSVSEGLTSRWGLVEGGLGLELPGSFIDRFLSGLPEFLSALYAREMFCCILPDGILSSGLGVFIIGLGFCKVACRFCPR